jgi:cytochrome P450
LGDPAADEAADGCDQRSHNFAAPAPDRGNIELERNHAASCGIAMSTTHPDVLRPAAHGLKAAIKVWVLEHLPFAFRILRAVRPIARLGNNVVVTRYDDVREVFLNDAAFRVTYFDKLNVIMGGTPFFLSMDDTPVYRRDTDAMRKVVRISDITQRLTADVERMAQQIVAGANGSLEVVDQLARRIAFELYSGYLGVTAPPGGDLQVYVTRLFEFQFADPDNDPSLRAEVDMMAPAMRNHIQHLIDARRSAGQGPDNVLGRCVDMQAQGIDGFSDEQIRNALLAFIYGGPPQVAMGVPQALEQLLRRPDALAGAQQAARDGDDKLLAGYFFEAMRFDPIGPFVPRVATKDASIAAGTSRAAEVPKGANVYVAFSSAMMDQRKIPDPQSFDPRRPPDDYIHFGDGLHQCFGIHLNKALLPLILKPLLQRKNLRRAAGPKGKLIKRGGVFADTLFVNYD